ncbi:uncharacterized protein BDV17DRAFT_293343 [Aspergillus undulatus]|uniref:uncharacterized protein n=1 Tax=Aspergillus undulatus TaxID=1810928 RepID=UPI003CCCB52D
MATVPLRVATDRTKTVDDLLQQVQLQAAEMMPFEQIDIQQIRRLSEDCGHGCQFGSHMVIQRGGPQDVKDQLFESAAVAMASDLDPFKLYAICLEFVLEPNSIRLQASFDSAVMPLTHFSRLMVRFENVMRQISSPEVLRPLALLDTSSLRDQQRVWSWNDIILEESRETIHEIFGTVAAKQPCKRPTSGTTFASLDGPVDGVECIEKAFHQLVDDGVKSPASLNAPLVHFKIIRRHDAQVSLVFSMSHAVYDAISFRKTLEILSEIYNDAPRRNTGSFSRYLGHIQHSKENSYPYWQGTLRGSSITRIPGTQMTGSLDVVLGRVVSGRAGVPGALRDAVGPCLNRVPVRAQFTADQTRTERLATLQRQQAESLAHETVGLHDIVAHCTDWARDMKRFGCWIQYQNVDEQPRLDIPSAVGALRSKEMWEIPVAADFLEFSAIPGADGTLTVRVLGGPGYETGIKARMLECVYSELGCLC